MIDLLNFLNKKVMQKERYLTHDENVEFINEWRRLIKRKIDVENLNIISDGLESGKTIEQITQENRK